MNRREILLSIVGGALGLSVASESHGVVQKEKDVVDLLTDVRSAMKFSDESVAEEDLKRILQIGLNSPSGHNTQPWFLSVVSDRVLLFEIDKKVGGTKTDRLSLSGAPVVIFVSIRDDSAFADFSAGTICDRMAVAANLTGYGAKMMTSPCKVVNDLFKDRLFVPQGYSVSAVLLLGVEEIPSVDGVSGATKRIDFNKKVVFVK